MNFLEAVNELLIIEGIISGDDDEISSFSDSQHVISTKLAKRAVQQELASLIADQVIPYERETATLTTVVGTRTYALATGFTRFRGTPNPYLWEIDDAGDAVGPFVKEFPGGEESLIRTYFQYTVHQAKPIYWYWVGGSELTIGLYPIPDVAYKYRYYYEKDVSVSSETDTMPFVTNTQSQQFVQLAARKFKYLRLSAQEREVFFPEGVERDDVLLSNRAILNDLLTHKQSPKRYGRRYGRNEVFRRDQRT